MTNLGVGFVIGPGQQHSAGPNKAAEVVHVAVGVEVCIDALWQPDDLLYGQILLQLRLNLLLGQVWVAIFVQQALCCRDQ